MLKLLSTFLILVQCLLAESLAPSCGGDPNAQAGCGFRCGKHCSKDFVVPKPCPCQRNGCQCKCGFVYDDINKKCVRPNKCPKCSQQNEILVDCPAAECSPGTCAKLGFPYACPLIDGDCPVKSGCVCRGGYVRNQKGVCIPASDCPSCGGDINARSGCGTNCGKRCTDLGKSEPVICPLGCRLYGCDCKDGFYLNNEGKCVLPSQCNQTSSTSTTTTPTGGPVNSQPQCSEAILRKLLAGIIKFSLQFLGITYKTEIQKAKPQSQIMSASSVFVPMGVLALYAENDTFSQLMAALNLETKDEIRCVFPVLTNQLTGNENVTSELHAKVYATNDHPLTQNFTSDTKTVFGAEAQSVNFKNGKETADIINAWVASVTNNRIQNIAKDDMFDSSTRLVLANAIYFLGNWSLKFDEADTKPRDFYVSSNKTVLIPTMYQSEFFAYAESSVLDCKVLKMLYSGGNFSFVVMLPNQNDGLSAMIDKLTPDVFYNAVNSVVNQNVEVYLPKMKIESSYDLISIMSAVGIVDIFSPDNSRLNDVLEEYEPLFISAAVQKAFVEVAEKGTEAAAANIFVGATTTSVGPIRLPKVFQADHPYAYFIMNGDVILFSGTFIGDLNN